MQSQNTRAENAKVSEQDGGASKEELPCLRIEKKGLSRRALELGKSLPSYTKGQLAFYALKKGKLTEENAAALLDSDQEASEEYAKLTEVDLERTRQNNRIELGTAVVGIEFQAYQPRVNKNVIMSPQDPRSAYSIDKSMIEGDEFITRVRDFVAQTPLTDETSTAKTYLGKAVRNTIIPIIVMGEILAESGVKNALTLTLPETTFRLVKQFYPNVFERMKKAHEVDALDVGLSNAHHSIAPLLSRDDMMREYDHSLRYYLAHFTPKDGMVSLHVPEQAKTDELFHVLTDVEAKNKVNFIVCFDSLRHNAGFDITKATNFELGNPPTDVTAFFRAFNACDSMAFHAVNSGDPLSERERMQHDLSGLNAEREVSWAHLEAKRLMGLFVSDLFGTERNHGVWRNPLYEGRNSAIILANDAEFIGLHHPGEAYPFHIFLQTLGEYGIEVASFRKTLQMVGSERERERQPYDASWSGDFGLWINPQTQWLRDIVGNTLSGYKGPLKEVTDMYMRHNPGVDEDSMPREIRACWENYGLSLISCPYWWSGWEKDYPNNVPVIPELFRNMLATGRDLNTVINRMLKKPDQYNMSLSDVDETRLNQLKAQVAETDRMLRQNERARSYPQLRELVDSKMKIKD
ncbi:MAG: hypothetical protein KKD39_08160 [Candidatus Altiarchaeota archaeon]|nr:hypothetical protein [Candidatus Altiarchaeota archaeon]